METESGKNFASLISDLVTNGAEYQVFQACFLAEIISGQWHPERRTNALEQTGLRFKPYEQYIFPPRDIRAISASLEEKEFRFVVNFMGLYGINSPLPRCYHEMVATQRSIQPEVDIPLQDFLDMFNSRFYWLYYQAWKKYRYFLHLDENPENKITQRLFSFLGVNPLFRQGSVAISPFRLLPLAGILASRNRNKAGLHVLLTSFFPAYKIGIQEFVPQLVKLAQVPKLGGQGEQAAQLGINAVAGSTKLDYTTRICISIGPMDFSEYLEFTPKGHSAALVRELMGLYLNDAIEYDVTLVIRSATIVTIPWNNPRLQLGVSIWLGQPKSEFVSVCFKYEQYTDVD